MYSRITVKKAVRHREENSVAIGLLSLQGARLAKVQYFQLFGKMLIVRYQFSIISWTDPISSGVPLLAPNPPQSLARVYLLRSPKC